MCLICMNIVRNNKTYGIFSVHSLRLMESDFISYLTAKLGFAQTTIVNMRCRFRYFFKWLADNKLELNESACEKFILYKKETGYSTSGLNSYLDLFRCLDRYYKDRDIPIVLSSGFKKFTREKKHIDVLSISEIEKLTTTPIKFTRPNKLWIDTDKKYLLLTCFLAYSGCRYSEARDLLIENVDVGSGRVVIPRSKNGEFRYIFLPPQIILRLKPLLKGDPKDRVFKTCRDDIIYDSNFLVNLRKRAKQCGINKRIYPHLFRHSFATQLIVDGVPIESVATILGHKDISTTYDNYLHLAETQIKRSMYRHELFKKSSPPNEIIQSLVESFRGFKLDSDTRFKYELREGKKSLNLTLCYK